MTVLAFLVALGVLVTVHEWAHYRVAVACGVQVLTFSVGFGKPLLRWKSRHPHEGQDTEFVIGLIPLGGYVRMLDATAEDVPPALLPRAFDRQPLRVRSAVVAAGPLANLLLAVVLYAVVFFAGQHQTKAVVSSPMAGSIAQAAGVKSGDEILRVGLTEDALQDVRSIEDLRWWLMNMPSDAEQVWWEVQSQGVSGQQRLALQLKATESATSDAATPKQKHSAFLTDLPKLGIQGAWTAPVIGELQAGKPAQRAGLSRGDVVLRVDGQRISDAAQLRHLVRASGARAEPEPQVWEVQRRQHGLLLIEVTPERIKEGDDSFGRVGAHIGGAPATVWVELDVVQSVSRALERTWDMSTMTLQLLTQMVLGEADWRHLSGPLTMADYAGRSASLGLTPYLLYLAALSVSLGVFNLLPLPMLDGGHLMYYLYEAFTGRAPSQKWLDVMQRLGIAVLLGLMAVSFFNDVVRLGWLG
jgi:regulator of sigma E protease